METYCVGARVCRAWPGLPRCVCEQILSTDMETYCVGARVCRAWNQIEQSKSCKPRELSLRAATVEKIPTVFSTSDGPWEYVPEDKVVDILKKLGSSRSETLFCDLQKGEVSPAVSAEIAKLDNLKTLCLFGSIAGPVSSYLKNWACQNIERNHRQGTHVANSSLCQKNTFWQDHGSLII